MQRLWHRLNRVPGRTQCIYCNTLTTNTLRPKLTSPIFPLELFRSYDALSLFNINDRRSDLDKEKSKILPKHKSSLLADFHRSLSTQDIDRIWPLYTYFYNNDLLPYLTRKNYHNLFIYTIRSRASQKNLNRLIALVDDMKQRGFSLKLSEYNALIDWVGGKTVPHRHAHHLTEALKLFEEMQQPYVLNEDEKIPKEPIQPTVPTFNTLIHIAAALSDLRTAQKLYHDMLSRGLKPDIYTYCTLLHVMGRLGDVNGMDMMLKEMKQNGVKKNIVIWNVVMAGYAANGLTDRAFLMFDQMMHNNKSKNKYIPKADAVTFKLYIDLLLKMGKRDEAVSTLYQMQQVGVRPIVTIYNALFASFMTNIDEDEDEPAVTKEKRETVQKLYQQMKDVQVKPNSETMYTLVSAFLDIGDTKSALEAFVFLSEKADQKEHASIQNTSVAVLAKTNKSIKKKDPLKVEIRPELLERLNSILTKKSM